MAPEFRNKRGTRVLQLANWLFERPCRSSLCDVGAPLPRASVGESDRIAPLSDSSPFIGKRKRLAIALSSGWRSLLLRLILLSLALTAARLLLSRDDGTLYALSLAPARAFSVFHARVVDASLWLHRRAPLPLPLEPQRTLVGGGGGAPLTAAETKRLLSQWGLDDGAVHGPSVALHAPLVLDPPLYGVPDGADIAPFTRTRLRSTLPALLAAARAANLTSGLASRERWGGLTPSHHGNSGSGGVRVLLLDGSAVIWGYDGSKPVLGEIVQWSDLYGALIALGADVTFVTHTRQLTRPLLLSIDASAFSSTAAPLLPPTVPAYDAIVLDYMAFHRLEEHGLAPPSGDRVFLLDSFGTAPTPNFMTRAEASREPFSLYCCRSLRLDHILTLSRTSNNSLLANIVLSGIGEGEKGGVTPPLQRSKTLIVAGKNCNFLATPDGAAARIAIAAFQRAGWRVVDTMSWKVVSPSTCPARIANATSLGVLKQADMWALMRSSRALLALGKPLIGSQLVEGLAEGLTLIMPRFSPPRNCSSDAELSGKPICESWTSQHPALEGERGVILLDDMRDSHAVTLLAHTLAELPDTAFAPRPPPPAYEVGAFLGRVARLFNANSNTGEGLAVAENDAPPTQGHHASAAAPTQVHRSPAAVLMAAFAKLKRLKSKVET